LRASASKMRIFAVHDLSPSFSGKEAILRFLDTGLGFGAIFFCFFVLFYVIL
jgi:hypothetical protein